MKTSVERIDDTKVKLAITLEATEVDAAINQTAKRLATEVRIPGFRPGRAPRRVLETRLGKDTLYQEAVRDEKGASKWYGAEALPAEVADLVVEDSATMTAEGVRLVFSAVEADVARELEPQSIAVVIGPDMEDVRAAATREFPGAQVFVQEHRKGTADAVLAARQRGIDISGPFPGDTVFVRASRREFDAVIRRAAELASSRPGRSTGIGARCRSVRRRGGLWAGRIAHGGRVGKGGDPAAGRCVRTCSNADATRQTPNAEPESAGREHQVLHRAVDGGAGEEAVDVARGGGGTNEAGNDEDGRGRDVVAEGDRSTAHATLPGRLQLVRLGEYRIQIASLALGDGPVPRGQQPQDLPLSLTSLIGLDTEQHRGCPPSLGDDHGIRRLPHMVEGRSGVLAQIGDRDDRGHLLA